MLQIISGKFFKSSDRHVHEAKGITYANYSWVAPIKTSVATLEPVGGLTIGISPFVICYTNQIEKEDKGRKASLLRTGDAEIVRHFECIATFGLKSLFGGDRWEIEFACRAAAKDSSDISVPQRFVPRFFAAHNMGKAEEVEAFGRLMDKVIGLPRGKYSAVITTLETFRHALQVLSHNVNMAYALLVYCLESLSQQFDQYEPAWEDYEDTIRSDLDALLSHVDAEKAAQIRSVLLRASSLRLQRRFTEFVQAHITDRFFVEEAAGREQALRPSELGRALKNTYRIRSRYVHMLEPIPDFLRLIQLPVADVFRWDSEPYLTFGGLLRVVHHVIGQFIEQGECLQQEDYNWRQDLPGIIMLKLAPQYWIWNTQGVQPDQAVARLSGFLGMFQEFLTDAKPLVDLSDLMREYERLLPSAQKKDKTSMLALYKLFNALAPPDKRSPSYDVVMKREQSLYDECGMEMLLVRMLLEETPPWSLEECTKTVETFHRERFGKRTVTVPVLIELALTTWIANGHLRGGNLSEYDRWARIAYLEATGIEVVQKYIATQVAERAALDPIWIGTRCRKKGEEAEANESSEQGGHPTDTP